GGGTSVAADGEVRQAVDRLGELEGNGFQGQTDVALDHEMQVRAGAVAGVTGPRDLLAGGYPAALADHHRALHQVKVDAHGAVVVQDAHVVAGRVVATAALRVLDAHHHAGAGGEDRGAFRHGDVHRVATFGREVAVLAVGTLGQTEGPARPGQRIAVVQRHQARIA